MKNITKKITAITSAAAVITAIGTIAGAQTSNDIYINGDLSDNGQIKIVDNKKFIPLRAICEKLGFNVEWQNDTRTIIVSSLPVYITFTPDADGYTFAKTAPMLLGEAPRLIDDCTYVPINFIDEILMGTFEEKENGIYITYGEEKQTNKVSGLICEMIYNNEKLVQIAIGDKEDINSQTILNLSEELAAKAVELGLKEGSYIEAEITDIQTASIPPQVIPTSLTTTDLAIDNTVEVIGTVCELVYNEDNILTQIIIGTKDDPATQTAFNLADGLAETVKELGIKEGSKIIVAADPVQTKSIPPQQFIHSIDLLRAVDISGTVCEVIYEEEKIIQIAIGDKEDPMSQVVLNLTDELSEIAKNLDIKEGTKIKGTAKDIQTMSIPPQQPLLTLEIDK